MQKVDKFKTLILQASELPDKHSLFIPCHTKKEQQKNATKLGNLAKDFVENIDPSVNLVVAKTFQDKKLWIKITKYPALDEVFVLDPEGKVSKTTIKE